MRHPQHRRRSGEPAELLIPDEAAQARAALEARWLTLTCGTLPALAPSRGWPVRADHCFQRILLDHACNGRWYDHITARPAYRHADAALLLRAITLGEAVAAGTADLAALNRQSLAWRGKPEPRPVPSCSPATSRR